MSNDLNDFGDELAGVRADSKLQWAEVDSAEVERREDVEDDVGPSDDDASDEGLTITYRLASGKVVEEWYEMPSDWDPLSSNLVLLLMYLGVEPNEIERLDEEDGFELPMEHVPDVGGYRPDWEKIEVDYWGGE